MTKKLTANEKVLNYMIGIRRLLGSELGYRDFPNNFRIYTSGDYVTVEDNNLGIEVSCFYVSRGSEEQVDVEINRKFDVTGVGITITESQILSSLRKAYRVVLKSGITPIDRKREQLNELEEEVGRLRREIKNGN
jgi:hypothetical protein